MIPARLIWVVPEHTTAQVDAWREHAYELHNHDDWTSIVYRDPIDPSEFPITSPHWRHCKTGAQLAGLIRLEAVWNLGGVYLDSDVQLFKRLDPLLHCSMFAAWEDDHTIPDAVFGATPHHDAVGNIMEEALRRLHSRSKDWRAGNGAWSTGPGAFTAELSWHRSDVLLLPPGAFYEVHYTEKDQLGRPPKPYEFGRHHWAASWLPESQRP